MTLRDCLKRCALRRESPIDLNKDVNRWNKVRRKHFQEIAERAIAKTLLQRCDFRAGALKVVVFERFRSLVEIHVSASTRCEKAVVVEVRCDCASDSNHSRRALCRRNAEKSVHFGLQGDNLAARGCDEAKIGVRQQCCTYGEYLLRSGRVERCALKQAIDGRQMFLRDHNCKH
jgi:hypothetical protein